VAGDDVREWGADLMARRVQGAGRIKSILRGMPKAFRDEMVDVFNRGGASLKYLMQRRAPSRTGRLRQGIDFKVWPRSLTLKVGLLGTKSGRSDLFYGRIQDLGRKAQTVRARRANTAPYELRVRGMPGKKFITGQMPGLRQAIRERTRGVFGRALRRISGGDGG